MNTHQALGHMRALLNAQHAIHQAQFKIRDKNMTAAGKFLEAGVKEMATVKEGLTKSPKGELSTAESMLRLLFDDLDKQRKKIEAEVTHAKTYGSRPNIVEELGIGKR